MIVRNVPHISFITAPRVLGSKEATTIVTRGELLGKIKRMQVREKLSERAIAKCTGLSRNTVHKWLQSSEEVQVPKYVRAKGFNKLGDFTVVV
jgi:hypothetical protein